MGIPWVSHDVVGIPWELMRIPWAAHGLPRLSHEYPVDITWASSGTRTGIPRPNRRRFSSNMCSQIIPLHVVHCFISSVQIPRTPRWCPLGYHVHPQGIPWASHGMLSGSSTCILMDVHSKGENAPGLPMQLLCSSVFLVYSWKIACGKTVRCP